MTKSARSYATMAAVYDRWMNHDGVPYDAWWRFVANAFRDANVTSGQLLDLGCGTGRMLSKAADAGFKPIGVDASADMLAIARRRLPVEATLIVSTMQDLDFDAVGEVDAAMCCFDALNYVTEPEDLRRVVHGLAKILPPGSPFVFDLRSRYTLEHSFAQGSTGDVVDEFAYVWRNNFDPSTAILKANVSFFVPIGDDLYQRFDELHVERSHSRDDMLVLLDSAGFDVVGQFDRYRPLPLSRETDRETWVTRRRQ